jgi:hypothetical protein
MSLAGLDLRAGLRQGWLAPKGSGRSCVVERWLEEVGLARLVERELLLAPPARAATWGRPCGQAQVLEDLLCDVFVLDHRDHAHGAIASWADQDVDGEGAREQVRPVETARAIGSIGAMGDGRRWTTRRSEWFQLKQVIEVFSAFRESRLEPSFLLWRDISNIVGLDLKKE